MDCEYKTWCREKGFGCMLTVIFPIIWGNLCRNDGFRIARHSPVATGTERNTANLRSIGHTGTLELLGKESADEDGKPMLDDGFIVGTGKSNDGQVHNSLGSCSIAYEVVQEEIVQFVRTYDFFGTLFYFLIFACR